MIPMAFGGFTFVVFSAKNIPVVVAIIIIITIIIIVITIIIIIIIIIMNNLFIGESIR